MQTFTDLQGEEWRIEVTYGDVIQVEKHTGISLLGLFDEDLRGLASLVEDLPKLVDVAACLCGSQIEARGLTAEDFARRLGGDVLEQVATAVIEATVDFFPNANRREALRGLLVRLKRIGEIATKTLPLAAFAEMDSRTDADYENELRNLLSRRQGSLGWPQSPEPLES